MTDLRSLEVILTARCNLSCGYCYQNAKQARSMEWRTLESALDRLLSSPEPELRVLFIGGEPLLELPLIRRAVEFVAVARGESERVVFGLSTNGVLLDREAADFLEEHAFEVQLSFDGVPAAQDLRGRGTHAELDRLLGRLRVEQPRLFHDRLRVAITLAVRAIPHLADSVAYFLEKGVTDLAIEPAVTPFDEWSPRLHDDLERQFARIFEASLRHYELTGEVPLEVLRKTSEASLHKPRGRSLCGVGSGEAIAVDVDGQVDGCVTFSRSYQRLPVFLEERLAPMRMGRIDAPDFEERRRRYTGAAKAAEIFDDHQDKFSSYGRCGECRHLSECSICPVTIGYPRNDPDPRRIPDFACAYNLVALDHRARFPRLPGPTEILRGTAPIPAWMKALERAAGSETAARTS